MPKYHQKPKTAKRWKVVVAFGSDKEGNACEFESMTLTIRTETRSRAIRLAEKEAKKHWDGQFVVLETKRTTPIALYYY